MGHNRHFLSKMGWTDAPASPQYQSPVGDPLPPITMKQLLTVGAAVLALATLASAQTTILREDFNAVPPAGWSQIKNNPSAQGWIKSIDNRAWHEDEFNITCDSDLISPVIDCSGYSGISATFRTSLNWADYQANHPNSLGDGVSNLYVRVNGGAWQIAWTDTRIFNSTDTIVVDISSFAAGNANVEFAFHYYGTYAHELWVDWVQIDGQGGGPSLAKSGSCPGAVTVTASGCTAGGSVAVLYGVSGNFVKNGAPCNGLTLGISAPTLGGILTANGSGSAAISFNAPSGACGLTVQAVDVATCTATNTITL